MTLNEIIFAFAFALFWFIVLWISAMREYHKKQKKLLDELSEYKGDIIPQFFKDYSKETKGE